MKTEVCFMDSQLIGAGTLMLLAYMGFQFEMQYPEWLPVFFSAVIGSIQASAARLSRGFLKGVWSIIWAVIAGVSCGLIVGQSTGSIMGLEANVAIVLPVYIFALIGARLVMWLSTGVDVAAIGQSILDRLIRTKD